MEDTDLKWRKASYSSNGGGNCVEVGKARRGVLVRDTKQNGTGPVLRFSPAAWRRFADRVKRSLVNPLPGVGDVRGEAGLVLGARSNAEPVRLGLDTTELGVLRWEDHCSAFSYG
jgi:hypothetical protein